LFGSVHSFATNPKIWKLTFANLGHGKDRMMPKGRGDKRMYRNEKSRSGNFGSKTNFTANEIKAFSFSDYKSELEPVQRILKSVLPGASMHAVIDCFDSKRNSELDGYRFRLVPLC